MDDDKKQAAENAEEMKEPSQTDDAESKQLTAEEIKKQVKQYNDEVKNLDKLEKSKFWQKYFKDNDMSYMNILSFRIDMLKENIYSGDDLYKHIKVKLNDCSKYYLQFLGNDIEGLFSNLFRHYLTSIGDNKPENRGRDYILKQADDFLKFCEDTDTVKNGIEAQIENWNEGIAQFEKGIKEREELIKEYEERYNTREQRFKELLNSHDTKLTDDQKAKVKTFRETQTNIYEEIKTFKQHIVNTQNMIKIYRLNRDECITARGMLEGKTPTPQSFKNAWLSVYSDEVQHAILEEIQKKSEKILTNFAKQNTDIVTGKYAGLLPVNWLTWSVGLTDYALFDGNATREINQTKIDRDHKTAIQLSYDFYTGKINDLEKATIKLSKQPSKLAKAMHRIICSITTAGNPAISAADLAQIFCHCTNPTPAQLKLVDDLMYELKPITVSVHGYQTTTKGKSKTKKKIDYDDYNVISFGKTTMTGRNGKPITVYQFTGIPFLYSLQESTELKQIETIDMNVWNIPIPGTENYLKTESLLLDAITIIRRMENEYIEYHKSYQEEKAKAEKKRQAFTWKKPKKPNSKIILGRLYELLEIDVSNREVKNKAYRRVIEILDNWKRIDYIAGYTQKKDSKKSVQSIVITTPAMKEFNETVDMEEKKKGSLTIYEKKAKA